MLRWLSWIGTGVRLARLLKPRKKSEYPTLVRKRVGPSKSAIVFVHGFSGHTVETFGNFPDYVVQDSSLTDWNVFLLGYKSRLAVDIRGVWQADADISTLGSYLVTTCRTSLSDYEQIAFIAHSMGGLVVQSALTKEDSYLRDHTSHVFLFGTPSSGLAKAKWGRLLKAQASDMMKGGTFIQNTRQRWDDLFGSRLPFTLFVVAGSEDEFVPRDSSLSAFPDDVARVIPGNHLDIVKPRNPEALSVELVVKGIRSGAALAGPLNSARMALLSRRFQDAVNVLEPRKTQLDANATVQLALAYEGLGRSKDAIDVLSSHTSNSTDAMGTLGGALKRRWIAERVEDDAYRSLELYCEALTRSETANNFEQAHYHSNNIAFLLLAYKQDDGEAKRQAMLTLKYCDLANDHWRLASRGDAMLILDREREALEAYTAFVASTTHTRQLFSAAAQATWIAQLKGNTSYLSRVEELFQTAGLDLTPVRHIQ